MRRPVLRTRDMLPMKRRSLRMWLPLHDSAIGNPETPEAYLADVIDHNVRGARFQWDKPRLPDGRMLRNVREAYRSHIATAVAARHLLAEITPAIPR